MRYFDDGKRLIGPGTWTAIVLAMLAVPLVAGCGHKQSASATTTNMPGAISGPTKANPVPPQIQSQYAAALKQYSTGRQHP